VTGAAPRAPVTRQKAEKRRIDEQAFAPRFRLLRNADIGQRSGGLAWAGESEQPIASGDYPWG
jgi:hypothetical protein